MGDVLLAERQPVREGEMMPDSIFGRMMNGPLGMLLFIRIYCVMIVLAVGLGVVVLAGDVTRFSGPGFAGPRDVVGWVPGVEAYQIWGGIFLCYGILLLMGLGKMAAVHILRAGMIVYIFFAISLALSVFSNPVASTTGVVAYFCFMLIHASLSDHLHEHGWE